MLDLAFATRILCHERWKKASFAVARTKCYLSAVLTPDQIHRLDSLSNYDWWEEGSDPYESLCKLIAKVSSSEEVWFAVIAKQWELAEMDPVLSHPSCDRGIALMVYWSSAPDHYYRKLEKHKPLTESEAKNWAAIKRLEGKLLADFEDEKIAFNPAELVGRPVTESNDYRRGIRFIPEPLRTPTKGIKLPLAPHSLLKS